MLGGEKVFKKSKIKNVNKNKYSLQQKKSNKKQTNLKLIIIVSSILTSMALIIVIYKNFPSNNNQTFQFVVYDQKVKIKVNENFTLDDLNIKNYDTDEFVFNKDDIIIVDEKEYSIKKAKELRFSTRSKIEVVDVVFDETVKKNVLPFEVETKEESSIAVGQQVLAQQGIDGEEVVTYTIEYRNGKEFKKTEKEKKINTPATKQLLLVGTGSITTYNGPIASGSGSNPFSNESVLNIPKSGQGENYNNSSGSSVTPVAPPTSDCSITVNGIKYPCQ